MPIEAPVGTLWAALANTLGRPLQRSGALKIQTSRLCTQDYDTDSVNPHLHLSPTKESSTRTPSEQVEVEMDAVATSTHR